MRTSQYLLSTLKETPSDAEIISHQLMLRAGMVRKLASGLYNWLPTGLRVLKKVENIVREEMNNAGAIEVSMPVVQPAELWEESGRWEQYGPELCRLTDRHNRPFVLGPTHEEVITNLVRYEVNSYKQLPLNLFQIQTKFRDEVRPRFGVMRGREFLMKDAYSFHIDKASLVDTYGKMHAAYCAAFSRMGLDFRPVQADTGSIGGTGSHEFQVLADSGEDLIAFSTGSDYAANIEMAEALAPAGERPAASAALAVVDTPNVHTIDEVAAFFTVAPTAIAKTLLVLGEEDEKKQQAVIALVLRGDHELNDVKAEKLPGIAKPLTFANDEQIKAAAGCDAGSIGPVGFAGRIIVDRAAAHLADFICGANETGKHLTGANWDRDISGYEVADIRNVVEGDPSPCGQGTLLLKRGIEVGHIFQLGTKYSEAMKATVLNEGGKSTVMEMGCYGIGVSRVVAAAIEQNYDDAGIIWPDAIAPFEVAIIPMNMHKSHRVAALAERFYSELKAAGIDVLFDDRKERPGVMFADMELIGIPYAIVIGERGIDSGIVEYKERRGSEKREVGIDEVVSIIKAKLNR